jgi:hypothetical protein
MGPSLKQQQLLKDFSSILQLKAEMMVKSSERRSSDLQQKTIQDRLTLNN